VLFRWLIREGERSGPDPMLRVDPPKVTRKVKPVLADNAMTKLLKTCGGQDFESRRDMAMLRILLDTGIRVSGLGGIRTEDVNLPGRIIRIVLKGGDEHYIPLLGPRTAGRKQPSGRKHSSGGRTPQNLRPPAIPAPQQNLRGL
jgi:site-specific recombinase XerD